MFVVVPTLYFKGSNRVTARNRITVKKTKVCIIYMGINSLIIIELPEGRESSFP